MVFVLLVLWFAALQHLILRRNLATPIFTWLIIGSTNKASVGPKLLVKDDSNVKDPKRLASRYSG